MQVQLMWKFSKLQMGTWNAVFSVGKKEEEKTHEIFLWKTYLGFVQLSEKNQLVSAKADI